MQIYLTTEHGEWLPIPYSRLANGESHPYVDLREHLCRSEEIPEARDFPELQLFFKAINGEESFFRTLACVTIPQEMPVQHLPHEMRSYIDITFTPWEVGESALSSFIVFHRFTEFIHERERAQGLEHLANVGVYLNLKPARHIELNIPFWCMEWWIISRARTRQEAREGWHITLGLLQECLLELSPSLNEEYLLSLRAGAVFGFE